ncbi:MAG: phosphate acyltransferase [Blautia sp.]
MVIQNFEQLRDQVQAAAKCKVVVIAAHDGHTLEAVLKTKEEGILDYVLVGKEKEILEIGKSLGHEIDPADVIDSQTDEDAVEKGIQLVREGTDFIQKDFWIHPVEGVVDKEKGIRTGKAMSHVALLDIPNYHKVVGVTDGGMMLYPDLAKKKDIANNAVDMFRGFGYERPKMAALCAVEVLNPKMQATVDAVELQKMAEAGEIPNCDFAGPISMDLAVSKESAQIKGYESPVTGEVDIFLVPNIDVGNIMVKSLLMFGNSKMAGCVVGAKCPIALNSRSATFEEKYYSLLACACMVEK